MPVSVTKNKVSTETMEKMITAAFGQVTVVSITELTEGFFNVAYLVKMADKSVVLKIAPSLDAAVMTHEKNIMFSEVDSMRRVAAETKVPVAHILFYDNSHEICGSDYFFMELLEGSSFSSCIEEKSEEEKKQIFTQIGSYNRQLNQITNESFGYYGQKERQGKSWFLVLKSMISDTFSDARRKEIPLPIQENEVLNLLEQERTLFEEVKTACFVHWDIWIGNVFVKEDTITGFIDFERCMWADPLMEAGFRTNDCNPDFLRGYGIETLTESQRRRAKWYDLYLFLIQSLESDYRLYEDRGMYEYATGMLAQTWNTLLQKEKNA